MLKLFHIYNSISTARKSALWYAFMTVLQKGIQIITIPIFTRILSEELFGLTTVYQSWFSLMSIVMVLDVDKYTGVGTIKSNNSSALASSLQGLMTVVLTPFALVFLIKHNFVSQVFGLPAVLVMLMPFHVLLSQTMAMWSVQQRYQYRYRRLVALSVVYSILMPVLAIAAILMYRSHNGGTIRIVAEILMSALFYGVLYIHVFHKGPFYDKATWKAALWFSIPMIFHSLSSNILNSADRIMIDNLAGRKEAAYYSVAYGGARVISIAANSIMMAFVPALHIRMRKRDFSWIHEQASHLFTGFAFLPVAVSIFAPELIRIMAPAEYDSAVWVVPSVAASVYFQFLYGFFSNVVFYFEKTLFASVATVIAATLNITLNLLAIPRYGYLAAGYTTLICYIVFAVAHYLFMQVICRTKLDSAVIYDRKRIIMLSVAVVTVCLGVTLLYPYPVHRYLLAGVGMLICFVKRHSVKSYFINLFGLGK